MKDIFSKAELIELMKSHQFRFTDSQKITDFYITNTGNPFDTWEVGSLIFDNQLMICIDKHEGQFIVRIGYDNGWVGGMSIGNCEYTFDLDKLTFDAFKTAFADIDMNRMYCLVNLFGTGNIDEILIRGTMEEIDAYATQHGYIVRPSQHHRTMPYYIKKSMPQHQRALSINVLSSQQYKNLKRAKF